MIEVLSAPCLMTAQEVGAWLVCLPYPSTLLNCNKQSSAWNFAELMAKGYYVLQASVGYECIVCDGFLSALMSFI